MITFAEAVKAADSWLRENWGATPGTPYVSPEGLQDDEDFLVEAGPREWLVDEDLGYLLMNNTVTFVSRETGEVRDETTTEVFDKIDAMTPVSVTD
jgi:hypothetical protein